MSALGFVLAGTHSGVGKTSLSLGVMGALARRGLAVAPFKVGPDYIDPTYHRVAAGRPSRNLDTWLMPTDEVAAVFARGLRAATDDGARPEPGQGGEGRTVAVVEGVMGLFDGLAGGGERCSTAEVAKLLGLPVFLVVDTSSMARSVGALVHGFRTFDPDLSVAGVVLNKVAGPSHAQMLRDALPGIPIVGVVPRRPDLHLASRHLGLIPTVEDPELREVLERIVDHVEEHVDLDALLEAATPVTPGDPPPAGQIEDGRGGAQRRPRVAVARDAAFSFYYEDNLDVLAEEGAELVSFRPVEGDGLPVCDALYLGGGYPEVYAGELAANGGLKRDLAEAFGSGLRLYAECGGYLYLGQEIEYQGSIHRMAGVLPTRASLGGTRLRMGYVTARALAGHPLAGDGFRGHLFHYSSTATTGAVPPVAGLAEPAYEVSRKGELMTDGWAGGGLVASYVHLHFRGSRPVARWLAGTASGQGGSHEQ
jgi:cobyrinic acid a,c-diamide synthase